MLAVDGVVCGAAGTEPVERVECLLDGNVPSIFLILDKHPSVQNSAWQ